MQSDTEAWLDCNYEDRWIFNKLELSCRLGHICGPIGIDVPKPDQYVVRPIINLLGMGKGARVEYLENSTDHLPPGFFWQERFLGRHLTVDFENNISTRVIEGFRKDPSDLTKFKRWVRRDEAIKCPEILHQLKGIYDTFNIEMIGNKIIEVHLRPNMDFFHRDSKELLVVHEGEDINPPKGYRFEPDPDSTRIGFFSSLS